MTFRIYDKRPEDLGYVRRADLERPGRGAVYERPDGSIMAFPPGQIARIAVLRPNDIPQTGGRP